jgi:predicted nucleic acid-binding protein
VAELLVKPLEENNETLADFYHGLEKSLGIKTLYPTEQTAALTAVLRAKYRIPTPDALNIAIAVSNFYSVFLTNDKTLQKVTEIKISGLGSSSSPAP